MTEPELAYRQGRSLADIIPPDRRRTKAAALVLIGMLAGATVFALAENVTARAEPMRPLVVALPPPSVQAFDEIRRDGWDAVGTESPVPDGNPDRAFALTVEGTPRAIVLVQCDVHGAPVRDGVRWATVDYDPAAPERFVLAAASFGPRVWQLAVFEGVHRMNDTETAMLRPMPTGTHRLELRAADVGQLAPGTYLRAYVVGPNREVVASAPLRVTDGTTAATISRVGTPSAGGIAPTPRAFDAAAATMLLENVDVEECAQKRGATSEAKVDVTFSNEGAIIGVQVESGPHPSSEAARCIVAALGTHPLRIPSFDGAPSHVKTTYALESAQD